MYKFKMKKGDLKTMMIREIKKYSILFEKYVIKIDIFLYCINRRHKWGSK